MAKILQKRASKNRWRPNRKWKYGGDPIFRLSDPDFLFDFLYIMGSISNRYGVCLRECEQRGTAFSRCPTVILEKKIQYDKPRLIALLCHETSKKRKTVYRVHQFGLSKFCVSDTKRPHGVRRQLHAPVIWRPNRKWKYGGDPKFLLSDPDFLFDFLYICLLYTSPSPRDRTRPRMPSSA